MTSCVEWRFNELSSSYSSRGNWKIVCQKRNTVTLGQAVILLHLHPDPHPPNPHPSFGVYFARSFADTEGKARQTGTRI